MNPIPELVPHLKQLRLCGILDSLEARNRQAIDSKLAYTEQMGLNEGARVEFRIDGRRLVIEKADEASAFSHSDLVRALRTTKHERVDLGPPQGKEIL